jgi:hypothetical protein
MEHRETDDVFDEKGGGDPLADREPAERTELADRIEPDDATPEEGIERPEPPEPDPDHVVEEKQKSD